MIRVSIMAIIYKKGTIADEDPKESKKACTETKKALKEAGIKMKKACISEHVKDVYGLDFWANPADMLTIYNIAIANNITDIEFEYRDIYQDDYMYQD